MLIYFIKKQSPLLSMKILIIDHDVAVLVNCQLAIYLTW